MNEKILSKEAEPPFGSVPRTISRQLLFDSLLQQVNTDTFEALERLLPRTQNGVLHSISSVTSKATSGSIEIDARTVWRQLDLRAGDN